MPEQALRAQPPRRARRARRGALIPAAAIALLLAGCGDAQPWKGNAGDARPASVAPASESVTGEPPMATTPADAPSPQGTTPDGSMLGSSPDDATTAIKQDRAAMLLLRTAISIVEGCKSGRETYEQCDAQQELGTISSLGMAIGSEVDASAGQVKLSATRLSLRATTRSRSGARFTVARSPKGDRFSCQAGPEPGACPVSRTWSW